MGNPEDLGRYRLKRLLGRGVLGEIWVADDREQEGARVVVKIMHAADDELTVARNQFAREARLVALLRHPHVVAVHDAGEAAGTSYMVMDLVEGQSLRKAMADPKTTLDEKVLWVRQMADALATLHTAGVVHRDLKPENVIVRPDRSICVVDLGIAKWTKFDLGLDGGLEAPKPKSSYVPPETEEDGIYDERGDQFAWGVVSYELLTGALPTQDSPPLTQKVDIPKKVAVAVDRARSVDRGDRWVGMDVVLDDVADSKAQPPLPRPQSIPDAAPPVPSEPPAPAALAPPAPPKTPPEMPRRWPLLWVGAVLVLVVVLAVVAALR
jgi:serine/threonine-protein kinase